MRFHGWTTEQHEIDYDETYRSLRQEYLGKLKPGTAVIETLERYYPGTTSRQRGAIWGYILPIVRQGLIDQGWSIHGVAPCLEQAKLVCYECAGAVGDGGERKRLHEMNRAEAGRFIEQIQHWAAQALDIYIPNPDPRWMESFKEVKDDDGSPR